MRSLVIGTAGHIDHGKSALVKALTGIDPDRLAEEQARGITIDLGFAHADIDDVRVAFVDVPGHERFVRNMLAGAGGVDAVILVVAADESVMPQTREHFAICRLLGIDRGVVVLTKSDLADAEMLALAALEVQELVAGSALADAPILPVSARTGDGLDALRAALAALARPTPRQSRPGVARLPIDRMFSVKGFGTVVTGTLVSGRIAAGDELEIAPSGATARVRGVQVHGRSVTEALAPARAAVNLAAAPDGLGRGATLITAGALAVTRRFDLHFDGLSNVPPLRHGARVRVHHGTADVGGRVAIAAVRAGSTAPWEPARIGNRGVAVPSGGDAFVRVRLDDGVAITRGDRVVLRSIAPPRTIGGGPVLDPLPPATGLRRAASLPRFLALDESAESSVRVWVRDAGAAGIHRDVLGRRAGLDLEMLRRVLGPGAADDAGVEIEGWWFAREVVASAEARALAVVAAAHDADAHDEGVSREAARQQVAAHAPDAFFDHVVASLTARGALAGHDRLFIPSRRTGLSARDRDLADRIDRILRDGGLAPPDLASLGRMAGASAADLEHVLRDLVRQKRVERLGGQPYHAAPLADLKRQVGELKAAAAGARVEIDVGTFKTRYGLTRKHAIPLLEYLDRGRVTRRVGDTRIVV